MEVAREVKAPISLYVSHSKESKKAIQLLKDAMIEFQEERSPNVSAPCVFASEGKFRGLDGIRAFVHLRLSKY